MLREIARSIPDDRLVSWGAVEAQVLAMPVTPEDAHEAATVRHPMNASVVGIVMFALLALPPFTVLGLAVWPAWPAEAPPSWFATIVGGLFVLSGASMLSPTLMSTHGRRPRGYLRITVLTVTVTAAAAILVLVNATSPAWLSWLAVATVLAGVVSLVLLARMRRSHREPRVDPTSLSPEDQWHPNARASVLDQLLRLGKISERDVDRYSMVEMPLGSWAELDTEPGSR